MTSIKQQLDTMLKRCLALHGTTFKEVEKDGQKATVVVPRDEAVREFMKNLASQEPDPKAMADKIIAAWGDQTGELQKELSAARIEQIGNFIASESTFKETFFRTVTLAPDEQPWFVNETKNEMRVGVIGDDGTPEMVRVVRPQDRTAVGLYLIASDKVRYKTMDIYRGDVSLSATATLDIARDIRFKMDRIHFDLLNAATSSGGCYGVFSYENARTNKATRVYLAHSGVKTAHLPTTNSIVNGTTGGTTGDRFTVQYYDPPKDSAGSATDYTGFRPAVLLAIADYCASWGDVLPGGGRLMPTGEIIVPASDIINIGLSMLPIANVTANALQDQVMTNGYMSLSVMGMNWRFIPDVTIDAGTCYPRLNLLPGISYEKPVWNKETVTRNDQENWEERYAQAAYGAVIPAQLRPRGLKVKYIAD